MPESTPSANPSDMGGAAPTRQFEHPFLSGPSTIISPPRPRLTNDGVPMDRLLEELRSNWPIHLVTVRGCLVAVIADSAKELPRTSTLFAMLQQYGDVDWRPGRSPTKEEFFEAVKQTVAAYDVIHKVPHEPPLPRVLYLCPALPAPSGLALRELLDFFHPATPFDRIGLEAFALTLFWGGRGGSRPVFLFTNQERTGRGGAARDTGRGIGKSTVVAALSSLCGDFLEADLGDDSRLLTRLLSSDAAAKRVVRVDNVKAGKLSTPALERLITTSVISGHQLYKGEAARENHLIYAITMNGACVSEDLASRSFVIELGRPANDPTWSSRLDAYLQLRRLDIIADIVQRLREPPSTMQQMGRFAEWESQILGRIEWGQAAIDAQRDRRVTIDGDSAEVDEICEALRHKTGIADQGISVADMTEVVEDVTGKRYGAAALWGYLRRIEVPGISKGRRSSGMRYFWIDPSPSSSVQAGVGAPAPTVHNIGASPS